MTKRQIILVSNKKYILNLVRRNRWSASMDSVPKWKLNFSGINKRKTYTQKKTIFSIRPEKNVGEQPDFQDNSVTFM